MTPIRGQLPTTYAGPYALPPRLKEVENKVVTIEVPKPAGTPITKISENRVIIPIITPLFSAAKRAAYKVGNLLHRLGLSIIQAKTGVDIASDLLDASKQLKMANLKTIPSGSSALQAIPALALEIVKVKSVVKATTETSSFKSSLYVGLTWGLPAVGFLLLHTHAFTAVPLVLHRFAPPFIQTLGPKITQTAFLHISAAKLASLGQTGTQLLETFAKLFETEEILIEPIIEEEANAGPKANP